MQTAFGNLETAVAMVHDLGAFWFLEKPVQSQALRLLLERAAAQGRLAEHTERLERQLSYHGVLGEMVGASPQDAGSFRAGAAGGAQPRRGVDHRRKRHRQGTGRARDSRAEPAARSGPFVAINCAAMPDTLMESELFGHEKGAFTGAVERRAGCFELAQNGTVLLDEIGDMPVGTQAKLLRVLEDGRVRRLGGKSEIQLDVRVIAATNIAARQRHSRRQVSRGSVLPTERVSRFRCRRCAIAKRIFRCSTAALLDDLNRKHATKVTDIAADVMERFRAYNWPGNVRELRNVLERAVILAGEGTIHAVASSARFRRRAAARRRSLTSESGELRVPVGYTIEQAERALIELTLEHTKNNKTRAAEILGISQKTLFNKLKEYGAQGAGAD